MQKPAYNLASCSLILACFSSHLIPFGTFVSHAFYFVVFDEDHFAIVRVTNNIMMVYMHEWFCCHFYLWCKRNPKGKLSIIFTFRLCPNYNWFRLISIRFWTLLNNTRRKDKQTVISTRTFPTKCGIIMHNPWRVHRTVVGSALFRIVVAVASKWENWWKTMHLLNI